MKRQKQKGKQKAPALAPGNEDILEKSAQQEEVQKGNFTLVTTLSLDEVDPS
jgi:hypothetical protein